MGVDTETIHTSAGGDFTIKLESNPTTGYKWIPNYDDSSLKLISDEFVSETTLMGSGGIQRLSFRALKPGATEIEVVQKRPWEKKPLRSRKFTVSID
ncbi:MAG TPA: protease inhibitor I42 family protein [Nitrososphaeraceae archaeon]|nr:protease inhibitor I42 family protein [Nitrososphaeraceae archaeon]